jgi:hypothetical protein
MVPRFLIFSWNADGLVLCKSLGKPGKSCVEVNFVPELRTQVLLENPDVIVFNTQGMARNDSHFHGPSGVAVSIVAGAGYRELTTTYADHIGFTYSLTKGGVGKSLSLQTTVYVRNSLQDVVAKEKGFIQRLVASSGYFAVSTADPVQGCLACTITLPRYGSFLLLNVNLTQKPTAPSPFADANRRCYNTLAINEIMERFYLQGEKPRHVIMSGDFNSGSDRKELRQIFQGPILENFVEGVANKGPEFEPTEQLMPHTRNEECQRKPKEPCYLNKVFTYGQRCMVLNSDSVNVLSCTRYQRVDYGSMVHGITAGVITSLTM